MDSLRNEIIQTQKIRSDLIKWKLLIVAGIGGAALGFSGHGPASNAPLALAIIPFACVYVDLLCRHLSLRNRAIGVFIRSQQSHDAILRDYEQFYDRVYQHVWRGTSLESVALVGCSIFLSVAIIPIGIGASGEHASWRPSAWPAYLFYGSGISGIILSLWLHVRYRGAQSKLDELAVPPDPHHGAAPRIHAPKGER